jgi:quinohemoprotein amine dehydrogenase
MRRGMKLGLFFLPLCVFFLSATGAFGEPLFSKSSMVRQKCAACHKPDPEGRLEVIEETRKSPEEWKAVVDRMIRINSAPLEDADFNAVIKELSRDLCLSPEEMAEVAYLNSDENSQYREKPKNEMEQRLFTACVRCHTHAKIVSHKMTPEQWVENRNLHLGYYPTVIPQMREMDWAKESQDLIEPLSKLYPFESPQWREWIQNREEQDLTGEWQVAGYQPGLGYYEGRYTFKAAPEKGKDEYLIEKEVRYENGTNLKMSGAGTLYSEYHLRYALAPTPLTGRIEGVFDLDAAEKGFQGKWWTVVQDTNAYGNESFYRTDLSARIMAAFPQALRAGKTQNLTLIGVGLPENVLPEDIKFSDAPVTVTAVEKADATKIVCEVSVDPGAAAGVMTLSVKDIEYAIKLYDKIDAIRITPDIGRARVSCGPAYPPQGVQFVARGIHFGPDGKPDTGDELVLDPVDARWQLEEEKTREKDDDLKYLTAPITNGLYTPVTTYGPIEARHQRREGVGLIAVRAVFTDQGIELTDRARLAVTVTDFVTHLK